MLIIGNDKISVLIDSALSTKVQSCEQRGYRADGRAAGRIGRQQGKVGPVLQQACVKDGAVQTHGGHVRLRTRKPGCHVLWHPMTEPYGEPLLSLGFSPPSIK